jgi:hypothetical protein
MKIGHRFWNWQLGLSNRLHRWGDILHNWGDEIKPPVPWAAAAPEDTNG